MLILVFKPTRLSKTDPTLIPLLTHARRVFRTSSSETLKDLKKKVHVLVSRLLNRLANTHESHPTPCH